MWLWVDVPDGIAPVSPYDPTWIDSDRTFRLSLRFDPGFGLIRSVGRLSDPIAGAMSPSDPVEPCAYNPLEGTELPGSSRRGVGLGTDRFDTATWTQ